MSLPMLAHDKANHVIYGALIFMAGAALALLSHFTYGSFEWIGRHVTGHTLGRATTLGIAMTSYGFTLNLGSVIGGVGVRYRLYSRRGVEPGTIAQVVATSILTNWIGYLLLATAIPWLWVPPAVFGWSASAAQWRMGGARVALFIACVVVATLAQGLTGFAFVLVLLGLAGLFQLAPVTDLANVATTLAVLGAAAMLRTSLRHVDRTAYREAVAGSAPGVLAGVLLLQWLSANVMTVLGVLLGVTIFACAITMLRPGNVLPVRSSGIWFGGFGLLSGLLGGLFSAGGPPLVYHFYRQPMAMEALRATLVAALTTMSVMRIVVVLATGQFSLLALKMILLAAPAVLGTSWLLRR